jgi:hypothetical protein
MTVRQAAILIAVISFVLMLGCGPVNAAIMLCGGVAGGLYLWAQTRLGQSRRSQLVASDRMNRLEL